MTIQEYAEFFRSNSQGGASVAKDALMLPAWSGADWQKLLALTVQRKVRAGEFVINRTALDRTLYLAALGEYEVGLMSVGGATIRSIANIHAGSVIGDQSFFDGQPRSANVWAVSAGVLLQLDFAAYEKFARDEPVLAGQFIFALGWVLLMRLRNTTLRFSG